MQRSESPKQQLTKEQDLYTSLQFAFTCKPYYVYCCVSHHGLEMGLKYASEEKTKEQPARSDQAVYSLPYLFTVRGPCRLKVMW